MAHPIETPPSDCALCPRLVAFRRSNRATHPDWHNAPVPSFGDGPVSLLIVGLAPGLRGANRTGRPFTGDHAGGLLYATLRTFALAKGTYDASADDGLRLVGTRISNAVRCVPPKNRPTAIEVAACRPFLISEIQGLPDLKVILALGLLAHAAVLTALGLGRSAPALSPRSPPSPAARSCTRGQLPLLPLQHQHGRSDRAHVRGRVRRSATDPRPSAGPCPPMSPRQNAGRETRRRRHRTCQCPQPVATGAPARARALPEAGRGGMRPTLPIRLTPMTATCRVPPLSRVKLGIGWIRGVARDAEQ